MRILVTGATGVYGRSVVERLHRNGHEVVAMARKPPRALPPGVRFAPADVQDLGAVRAGMEGCEVVVHLAFTVSPVKDRELSRRMNVGGTANVLEAMRDTGARRLVFASSAMTYGANPDNPPLFTEAHEQRPAPDYVYGTDKVAAERLIIDSGVEHVLARTAVTVGRNIDNLLVDIFAAPSIIGIKDVDIRYQLIHQDDIGRFFAFAAEGDRTGPVNVAPPMRAISFRELEDDADMYRRLWRGESVDYDGPIGRFEDLHMADTYDGPAPQVYSVMLGGPKACRVAASPLFDGVYLQPFLTVEAVHNAVTWIREACEEIGRDFSTMRIVQPIVSAPEMSDDETLALAHARMVTYIGQPGMVAMYEKLNGWDPRLADPIRDHEMFRHDPDRVDHHFHREDLIDVARLVPDEWALGTSLHGSLDACVARMQEYKDAGAHEICFYGSNPSDNAALIGAWREHRAARDAHEAPVGASAAG
ncbi:MAG: LLM class flavin-dependent oxidoreductase [Solirubrobacteraceae bacterium]|nr:LLM class flavin-dependent oxidoreductase [Solirubrobacteraceae bacterium]